MGSARSRVVALLAFSAVWGSSAQAWYGPTCYSDRTTQVTLTIPSISGETPGDVKVDFDDNDGKVKLGSIRASTLVKNAHEITLLRDPESQIGVFAVMVTSPRSTTGYKFELEFRKDPSECMGAIIKATDHATAPAFAHASQAGTLQLAQAPARLKSKRAPKPKPSPSPEPDETPADAPAPVAAAPAADAAIAEPKPADEVEVKAAEVKPTEETKPADEAKPAEVKTTAEAKPAAEAKPVESTPSQEHAEQAGQIPAQSSTPTDSTGHPEGATAIAGPSDR